MSAGRPVPILLNARAGARNLDEATITESFRGTDIALQRLEPAQLAHAISTEVAAGTPIIGVAGGDGTMRTAAAIIIDTPTALLPIPAGTLNHFSQRCGIADLDAAAAALHAPDIRALPVGVAGTEVFLNALTIGEYARVLRIRERWRRKLRRWPAILLGSTVTLFTLRRIEVTLETDGRRFERRTPIVWVGIGWGSFPRVHEALERRSHPDLELAIPRYDNMRANVALMLRVGWDVFRRRQPVRDPALEVLHTRDVIFRSPRLIDATADGEVLRLPSPLRVLVRDAALHVLVGNRMGDD